MAGSSICGTGFKPQGARDFLRYPPDDQSGILAPLVGQNQDIRAQVQNLTNPLCLEHDKAIRSKRANSPLWPEPIAQIKGRIYVCSRTPIQK